MAKAKRVHSTPRRTASKIQSKKRAKVKRPDDGREAALARRERFAHERDRISRA
jgi:hypothetical protein